VIRALEERLMRTEGRKDCRSLKEEIDEIGKRCARSPTWTAGRQTRYWTTTPIGLPD